MALASIVKYNTKRQARFGFKQHKVNTAAKKMVIDVFILGLNTAAVNQYNLGFESFLVS